MPTYSKFMACIHVDGNLSLIESKKCQSSAVKKIVTTCVESSNKVNLCNFCLTDLPDDVFLLLRSNKVKTFDVSENLLSILPTMVTTFTNLTTLNVSTNRLSALPRELVHCKQLTTVDISVNNFVQIPSVLLEMESISEINAKSNFITEVDDEELENSESLEVVNLESNPLSASCHDRLQRVDKLRIIISERKLEEWEDLSI